MAGIEIKDLPDSIELDRQAMKNIYGGSKAPLAQALEHRKKRVLDTGSLLFPRKNRNSLRG